jgi:prevent-host-death family protein
MPKREWSHSLCYPDVEESNGRSRFEYLMLRISITELRRSLSAYLRRVASGETLEITVRNRAVARIVSPTVYWNSPTRSKQKAARAYFAELRKTIKLGDLLSPTGARWTGDWKNVRPKA